jgi:signal recognition particle GTPase
LSQQEPSDAEPRQRGFFTRRKARLNQGRSWLSAGVAQAFGRNIDEDTLSALEDELLLADVGVEATSVLI